MCLSTAYMNSGNEQKEIMKDIARIEAEGQGFWLINLFGEKNSLRAVFNPLIFWTASLCWPAMERQFNPGLIPRFLIARYEVMTQSQNRHRTDLEKLSVLLPYWVNHNLFKIASSKRYEALPIAKINVTSL